MVLTTHELDPADRLAHFVRGQAGQGQPYEWWYFEFHIREGADTWVVVVSFHLPHVLDPVRMLDVFFGKAEHGPEGRRRIRDPFEYCGVATSIYRLTSGERLIESLVGFAVTRCAHAEVSSRGPLRASFGREGQFLTLEQHDSKPLSYRLKLDQRGRWASRGLIPTVWWGRKPSSLHVELDVTFSEVSPGFKIGEAGTMMIDRFGTRHHWVVVMPDAEVDAKLTLTAPEVSNEPVLAVDQKTVGYHDHQWGHRMPMHTMKEWSWGRLIVKPQRLSDRRDLLVYFRSQPKVERDPDSGLALGSCVSEKRTLAACVVQGRLAKLIEASVPENLVATDEWTQVNWPLGAARSDPFHLPNGAPPLAEAPDPPEDDSKPDLWRAIKMFFARPLARFGLKHMVGYHGQVQCRGQSETGPAGGTETIELSAAQLNSTVEPWPFYNRYIARFGVERGPVESQKQWTVEFGMTEFMEVAELLDKHTYHLGPHVSIPAHLLAMAWVSQWFTQIEPGAPRFGHLIRHLLARNLGEPE